MSAPKDPVIDYSILKALVVDDFPGMRGALRTTLANFGLVVIDMASNAAEAVHKLKNRHYEIIISDFNLGEGRDGQQLLEEMRHCGLVTLDTVFIMVTAESHYEKVVATAELAPDDYLIKPFNAQVLHNRVETILQRKLAFARAYRHYGKGELDKAVSACDEIVQTRPKYVVDALRFKGELLNALGRYIEAEELYRQVIAMRAIPWARMGLARALFNQKQAEEAETILSEVLQAAPEMVAAYDLLAEVKLTRKDPKGAQEVLQRATSVSAKTVHRQQRLGELAFENQDLGVAKQAYAATLEKGRNSIFVTHADYSNLCRVQIEQGDLDGAMTTLRNHRLALQASPEGRMAAAVVESVVYTRSGKEEAARRALDIASKLHQDGARGDGRLMLDMAATCMAQGRLEEGDAIVGEVARNAHDSESLLAKARKVYEDAGRGDVGKQVLSQATESVRKLNNDGVILAQKGDLGGALEKMLQAAVEAPHNPRVAMNAAWIALRFLDQNGMDHSLLERVLQLVDNAEKLAPGHTRIHGLRTHIREVEHKYGIRRR
jgi:DNA-binding response OmpR family regulator/thioredoxin-like negative regulator of GroEL